MLDALRVEVEDLAPESVAWLEKHEPELYRLVRALVGMEEDGG